MSLFPVTIAARQAAKIQYIQDGGDLVAVKATFNILSVSAGISNGVEVFVNGLTVGSTTEDLYVVSYDANWPGGVSRQSVYDRACGTPSCYSQKMPQKRYRLWT